MSRYSRDFGRSEQGGRGRYGADFGGGDRQRGRYGAEFGGGQRQRGGQGYDRGYDGSRGGRSGEGSNRYRSERGAAPWYANPDWSMAEGFGDFSGRGRYGGYWGATDLRPMMAGYDAEMRRNPRRNR